MRDRTTLVGEQWVVDTLQRAVEAPPGLHLTAVGLSSVGIAATGVLVAAGALILGLRHDRTGEALVTVAAAGVAYGIAHLLKGTVTRVAPYHDHPSHHAFPEGPGAFTAALAVALVPRAPVLAAFAATMTVLDGLSQVALGYHWPSDVLGAWIIGAACALVGRRLATR